MPGESPVISKGMINYQVYEDGNNKKGVQSDNTTIKHFLNIITRNLIKLKMQVILTA